MQKKTAGKVLLVIVCCLVAIFVATSCVPKKTTTPPSNEPSVASLQSSISTLQTQMATNTNTISSLQASVGKITAPVDYTPTINAMKADVARTQTDLKATVDNSIKAQDASITTTLATLKTELTALVPPRYAQVTSIGRRYIEVSVTGAGDYPVIITLYGTGLKTGEIDVATGALYDIADEFLFGTYSVANGTAPANFAASTVSIPAGSVSVNGGTFTSSPAIPTDPSQPPSAHTHSVAEPNQTATIPAQTITVPAQSINVPTYALQFTGTCLIMIIVPDSSWKATDKIELDIRDILGDVYYASASTGAGE